MRYVTFIPLQNRFGHTSLQVNLNNFHGKNKQNFSMGSSQVTYSQYCKLAVSGFVLLPPILRLPHDEFPS
jgi:hypothetical protein